MAIEFSMLADVHAHGFDTVIDVRSPAEFAEDHVPGASVGPLIAAAIAEQFVRLRDGDRFFHSRDPDLRQPWIKKIIDLKKVSLSDIVRWNTRVKPPKNMFIRKKAAGKS